MEINYFVLDKYKPENSMFTSFNEIEFINANLVKGEYLRKIKKEDLQDIRNKVVEYYTSKEREERLETMSSMQSITAVIDSYIYR